MSGRPAPGGPTPGGRPVIRVHDVSFRCEAGGSTPTDPADPASEAGTARTSDARRTSDTAHPGSTPAA
ncbi:hypothetical protein, partial [Actinomyces sp.]|uniref:hypothetical protein n=1 Tax=Actinomyces sp. TaxID=29317 RepID=UPI002896E0D8